MTQSFFKRHFQKHKWSRPHRFPKSRGDIQVANALAFVFEPNCEWCVANGEFRTVFPKCFCKKVFKHFLCWLRRHFKTSECRTFVRGELLKINDCFPIFFKFIQDLCFSGAGKAANNYKWKRLF